jgi:hypothetical protein
MYRSTDASADLASSRVAAWDARRTCTGIIDDNIASNQSSGSFTMRDDLDDEVWSETPLPRLLICFDSFGFLDDCG